ncbi:O-antigen ligase family protein [Bacillus haikouensis]|nr:O-antigen ligase family protein [Bacillus haikouensis]
MVFQNKFITVVGLFLLIMFISFISTLTHFLAIILSSIFLLIALGIVYNYRIKLDILNYFSIFIMTTSVSFNMIKHNTGFIIVVSVIFMYCISFFLERNHRKINNIGIYFFMIFWIIWSMGQIIFVQYGYQTLDHLKSLLFGTFIIWIMNKLINNKNRIDMLYTAWGTSIFITTLVGWWELLTNNHLPTSRAYIENISNVATAGFYNQNDYGFFLALGLPIMFYWTKKKSLYKIMGIYMLVSSFYFSYVNGSRSILLIFFVALSLYLISLIKDNKKLLIFFLISILIGVIKFWNVINDSFNEILTLNNADSSLNERQWLTKSALDIFQSNPYGVGPGNLELYMPIQGLRVHNFWLEILVNYGLIVFLGLIIIFAIFFIKKFNIDKETQKTINPMFWSVLIFIPTCVVSSSIFQMNITWFILGLIACSMNYMNKSKKRNRNDRDLTNGVAGMGIKLNK